MIVLLENNYKDCLHPRFDISRRARYVMEICLSFALQCFLLSILIEHRHKEMNTVGPATTQLHSSHGGGTKEKMRWTTHQCESKRLWGLYLVSPCGNDNDHLGSKRTTIHLNPSLPGKTHNPSNTRDPPLDRQQGENGTLKAQFKSKQSPFILSRFGLSVVI